MQNLRDLMRYMRNGIAHVNIEFIQDGQNRIEALHIWNTTLAGKKNWEAKLSINDLRETVYRFLDLIIEEKDQ